MKQIAKLLFFYIFYQFAFSFVATLPTLLVAVQKPSDQSIMQLALEAYTSTYSIALGSLLAAVAMIAHLILAQYVTLNKKSLEEISLYTLLLTLPITLGCLVSANIANDFWGLTDNMQELFYRLSFSPVGVLAITIAGPILEEMLFRGAIEGYMLQKGMRPIVAILLSALIFGLIHMNPAQIPFAFFLGIVFGWLYYRTGSLIPAILGHILNNSISVMITQNTPKELLYTTTAIDIYGRATTYSLLVGGILIAIAFAIYINKTLPKPQPHIQPINTNN